MGWDAIALMFPVLVVMYVRLAQREEQEMVAQLGAAYSAYAAATPAFFPRRRQAPGAQPAT